MKKILVVNTPKFLFNSKISLIILHSFVFLKNYRDIVYSDDEPITIEHWKLIGTKLREWRNAVKETIENI
jgi:hypothetical protein